MLFESIDPTNTVSVADEAIGPVMLYETSNGALIVPGPALKILIVTVSVAVSAQPVVGEMTVPSGAAMTASFWAKPVNVAENKRIPVNSFFIN